MKEEVKVLWLEALRSGQYQQGQETLRRKNSSGPMNATTDQFCCLGVLCDLYAKAHPDRTVWTEATKERHIALNLVPFDLGDGLIEHEYLPMRVRVWAGLDPRDPQVTYNDEVTDISSLNDNGVSFTQIADLIEDQL